MPSFFQIQQAPPPQNQASWFCKNSPEWLLTWLLMILNSFEKTSLYFPCPSICCFGEGPWSLLILITKKGIDFGSLLLQQLSFLHLKDFANELFLNQKNIRSIISGHKISLFFHLQEVPSKSPQTPVLLFFHVVSMKHLSWGHENGVILTLQTSHFDKTRLPFCLELIEESQDPDGTNLALLSRWWTPNFPMDNSKLIGPETKTLASYHSSMIAWLHCTNFKWASVGQRKVDQMPSLWYYPFLWQPYQKRFRK